MPQQITQQTSSLKQPENVTKQGCHCSPYVSFAIGVIVMIGSLAAAGYLFSRLGYTSLAIGGAGLLAGAAICMLHYILSRSASKQEIKETEINEEKNQLQTLETKLKEGINISKALQDIPASFFENKSQKRAKLMFSKAMKALLDASVYFTQAGLLKDPENLNGQIDSSIFHLSTTNGVENDIPRSSKDKEHVHLYQVASQYNAAESASHLLTPPIGQAMEKSQFDSTQGPLAQRTNPLAFELVTAFLTHLGFNMFNEVVPSAGKTYEKDSSIANGYFRPTDTTIAPLTDELKHNFSKAEYVCYSSHSKAWGNGQPVYLMLQAAPYLAAFELTQESDELQKYAALANYLALFKQGIALANQFKKPVVIHATAMGGGVFNNKTSNLQWGFEKAALSLQEQMKSASVTVQLEAFDGNGPMAELAQNLSIQSKSRIGD